MTHSTRPGPKPLSPHFRRCKPALDRIQERLDRDNPDLEMQKIEKVILLMFGPRPAGWRLDPRFAGRESGGIIPTIHHPS